MTATACKPDKEKYWRLLAEGLFRGQPLVALLLSVEQALSQSPMGGAVAALAADIQQGATLSQAMARQPSVFSKAETCLVEGGERLGILERVVLLILEATWKCPGCGNL
jgi:type II secretory pathway component PulF